MNKKKDSEEGEPRTNYNSTARGAMSGRGQLLVKLLMVQGPFTQRLNP
jgi:hypothetical protein